MALTTQVGVTFELSIVLSPDAVAQVSKRTTSRSNVGELMSTTYDTAAGALKTPPWA